MATHAKEADLRVRMSKLEMQKLKEIAEKRDMTVSEYVRYLVRQQWDKPNPIDD